MEYSGTIEFLLFVVWAVGSLLLAWFVRRLFYVYLGSVGLAAPMIGYSMVGYSMVGYSMVGYSMVGYSMVGYELLPMGGIIHGFCAGLFVLPFYFLFQRLRTRKMEPR